MPTLRPRSAAIEPLPLSLMASSLHSRLLKTRFPRASEGVRFYRDIPSGLTFTGFRLETRIKRLSIPHLYRSLQVEGARWKPRRFRPERDHSGWALRGKSVVHATSFPVTEHDVSHRRDHSRQNARGA